MRFREFVPFTTLLLLAIAQVPANAQTRDEKVRTDREQLADDERWIYNNLTLGIDEAKKTDKPLLIVLRCIP